MSLRLPLVIASAAKQSRAACALSGLPRRLRLLAMTELATLAASRESIFCTRRREGTKKVISLEASLR